MIPWHNLGGSFIPNWVVCSDIFYFHPYLGKIPILTNVFQVGWNHQLAKELLWIWQGFFDVIFPKKKSAQPSTFSPG